MRLSASASLAMPEISLPISQQNYYVIDPSIPGVAAPDTAVEPPNPSLIRYMSAPLMQSPVAPAGPVENESRVNDMMVFLSIISSLFLIFKR